MSYDFVNIVPGTIERSFVFFAAMSDDEELLDAMDAFQEYAFTEMTEDENGEIIQDLSWWDPTEIMGDDEILELSGFTPISTILDSISGSTHESFLREEALDQGHPIIFIDMEEKKIIQIREQDLDDFIKTHRENLYLNIIEYDEIIT